jgi:hypothetical protein
MFHQTAQTLRSIFRAPIRMDFSVARGLTLQSRVQPSEEEDEKWTANRGLIRALGYCAGAQDFLGFDSNLSVHSVPLLLPGRNAKSAERLDHAIISLSSSLFSPLFFVY